MAIVGDRPSTGVRFQLDRVATEPRLVYEGEIVTPEREFSVRAEVDETGEVSVTTESGDELADKARLLVRTVVRHAASEGEPPPRRIQRWRADK